MLQHIRLVGPALLGQKSGKNAGVSNLKRLGMLIACVLFLGLVGASDVYAARVDVDLSKIVGFKTGSPIKDTSSTTATDSVYTVANVTISRPTSAPKTKLTIDIGAAYTVADSLDIKGTLAASFAKGDDASAIDTIFIKNSHGSSVQVVWNATTAATVIVEGTATTGGVDRFIVYNGSVTGAYGINYTVGGTLIVSLGSLPNNNNITVTAGSGAALTSAGNINILGNNGTGTLTLTGATSAVKGSGTVNTASATNITLQSSGSSVIDADGAVTLASGTKVYHTGTGSAATDAAIVSKAGVELNDVIINSAANTSISNTAVRGGLVRANGPVVINNGLFVKAAGTAVNSGVGSVNIEGTSATISGQSSGFTISSSGAYPAVVAGDTVKVSSYTTSRPVTISAENASAIKAQGRIVLDGAIVNSTFAGGASAANLAVVDGADSVLFQGTIKSTVSITNSSAPSTSVGVRGKVIHIGYRAAATPCSVYVAGTATAIVATGSADTSIQIGKYVIGSAVEGTGNVKIITNGGMGIVAKNAGNIYINNAKATIFSNSSAGSQSVAINAIRAEGGGAINIVNIDEARTGGSVTTAVGFAGGATVYGDGTIDLKDGKIISNGGVGIYSDNTGASGLVTITGGSAASVTTAQNSSTASAQTAAIWSYGNVVIGTPTVISATATSNSAKGIVAKFGATVTINSGTVSSASNSAIDIEYGKVTVYDGTITGSTNPTINVGMYDHVIAGGVEVKGGAITAAGTAGAAIKVAGGATVVVTTVTGSSAPPVISANGGRAIDAQSGAVTVSDTVIGAGGNTHATGKLTISSVSASAIATTSGNIAVYGGRMTGTTVKPFEIKVTGATATTSRDTAAIRSTSGNITVGQSVAGPDSLYISATGGASGIVSGGNVIIGQNAAITTGFINISVEGGDAVRSAKTVAIAGQNSSPQASTQKYYISSKSGAGVVADSVYMDVYSGIGAADSVITQSGIGVSARAAKIVKGVIRAGVENTVSQYSGEATVTGKAIVGTGTKNTDVIEVTGGLVKAYGSGTAIEIGGAAGSAGAVTITANGSTPVIEAGNAGKAIYNAGSGAVTVTAANVASSTAKVQIKGSGAAGTAISTGGDITVTGGGATGGTIMIEANDGGTAINASAASGDKTLTVSGGSIAASDSIKVGIGGKAIVAAAGVTGNIGTVSVYVVPGSGGAGITAAGNVELDGAVVTIDDTLGTAVNVSGTASVITLKGASKIQSEGNGIVSQGAVTVTGQTVTLSGKIDANVTVQSAATAIEGLGKIATAPQQIGSTTNYKYAKLTLLKGFNVTGVQSGVRLAANAALTVAANSELIVKGSLNTVLMESGVIYTGAVANAGIITIASGGDLGYGIKSATEASLTSDTKKVVLSSGSKVNGNALVYTAPAADSAKTFLTQAKLLSAAPIKAAIVVPPVFIAANADTAATVYKSISYSFATKRQMDSLYNTSYAGAMTYSATGALPVGLNGADTVLSVSSSGVLTGFLTQSGDYNFTVKAENEAGTATKAFKLSVLRDALNVNDVAEGIVNGDTLLSMVNSPTIKYTGKSATVSIRGKQLASPNQARRFGGFGMTSVLNYIGVNGTTYGPTATAPVNVGEYKAVVRFIQGLNFDPTSANDTLTGAFKIEKTQVDTILAGQLPVKYHVPVGTAIANLRVTLPNIKQYGASYGDITLVNTNAAGNFLDTVGRGESPYATIVGDSVIALAVTAKSVVDDAIVFNASITGGDNIQDGTIRVEVLATSEADLKEVKPTVYIDYSKETLSNFTVGRKFTMSIASAAATAIDNRVSSDLPITADLLGKTVTITALASTTYMTVSDTQTVVIPTRTATVPTGITTDSASAAADDGKILGVTAKMEYRLAGSTGAWTPVLTDGPVIVAAGTYDVRVASTASAFGSLPVTVTVGKKVSTLEANREIPITVTEPEIAVTPQLVKSAVAVTVGPNPVQKSAGKVGIFYNGSKAVKGTLTVFNSVGGKVAKVKVSGTKKIGEWNVAGVPEGSYLLRGVLTGEDGVRVKVSVVVGVK